jgi:putative hemolysin
MNKTHLPAATERWTRFTYADENDPWWKKLLISSIEFATGRAVIERLYNQIRDLDVPGKALWGLGLQQLQVKMDYDAEQLARAPRNGPLVIIANHPFGVVDGLMLAALTAEIRDEFVFLVNEVLTRDARLSPFLLPIDFRENEAALRTNLESRRRAIERLKAGQALAIFPAGGVATSKTWFGPAEDLEWKRFVVKLIQQSRATVLPLYIDGQNSRMFQMVSQVSMPLRLGMLLYETCNKRGRTVKVRIGEPMSYEALEAACEPKQMLGYLQKMVADLK